MNNALDQTKENIDETENLSVNSSLDQPSQSGHINENESTLNELTQDIDSEPIEEVLNSEEPKQDDMIAREDLPEEIDSPVLQEIVPESELQTTISDEEVAQPEDALDSNELIVDNQNEVEGQLTDALNENIVDSIEETKPDLATESAEDQIKDKEETIEQIVLEEDIEIEDENLQEKLQIDYSKYSKNELFKIIEELAKETNVINAYKLAAKLKPAWDSFYEMAKHAAFLKFTEDGGESDSFEFKGDQMDQKAVMYFRKFRDAFKAEQNRKKEAIMGNLQTKLELVAKLRSLVNSEDSNIDIKALRDIQEMWRRTGPVPPEQFENLNASYQFLINKFYDNRSIFFEMLDLDRKKNLAAKEELIDKIEKQKDEPMIGKAVQTALQIQKDFQDIGPVPHDKKDEVWNRFRTAMDAVFERRKEFNEALRIEANKEWETKSEILAKLGEPSLFTSDRFDDWNTKTKELQILQDEWKAIKHVPRGRSEELTKRFWSEIKKFFHNKNEFFKALEAIRNQNIQLKNELVAKAEALKDSENWDATTQELKLLREEWKTVGPIPYKMSEAIYKKFNAAIDHFFERKKQKFNEQKEDEKKNLELKNGLISKIEALSSKGKGKMEDVDKFRSEFNSIGYVPHKDVGIVVSRFHKAIDDLILNSKEMEDIDKTRNRLKVQVNHAATSNEGYNKLQKQENYIRRRIVQLTEEIENLKNNMGFFANTKNAQSFLTDYHKKIQLAELEIKELREQLKIIN